MTSLFISRRFQKQPIYEALAFQDGIHLPSPGTLHQTSQRTVAQVMRAGYRMKSNLLRPAMVLVGG